jgi:hypothetical protein
LFGTLIWVIQMLLTITIFIHQHKSGRNSSPFDIPIQFNWEVRVGQCVCIFLVLANINDLYVPTHTISQALNMDNAGIKYVWVPNILKLISAIAVAIISLILIVGTDDLIELLTNFAGLTFISEIDNKLYGMAKNSCLGRSMKESSGGNQPANKSFGRIQVAITLVSFALMAGFWAFFFVTENNYVLL